MKADPAEVDRLYKEAVREWKVQSVLFVRESDAKAMAAQVKAGKSFDALATKAVADKSAKGNEPAQFVHGSKLIPPVLANVEKTRVGKVTPPIKVPGATRSSRSRPSATRTTPRRGPRRPSGRSSSSTRRRSRSTTRGC